MDKDATIARVGAALAPERRAFDMSRRKSSSGGCPFMTTFDFPMPNMLRHAQRLFR